MPIVADTSAILAACLPDEGGSYAAAAAEATHAEGALVPAHWHLELANALLQASRRGRLTEGSRARIVAYVESLPVAIDPDTRPQAFRGTTAMAERHSLTAYDAAYLELAVRTGSRLATVDAALRRAALVEGVLFSPGQPDIPAEAPPPIWSPTQRFLTDSNLARFMQAHGIPDYRALVERAAADTEWFWNAALADMGLDWFKPYDRLLDASAGFPWAKWFVGGEINIVHNCIDRHVAEGRGDWVAVRYEGDSESPDSFRNLTFAELQALVNRAANGLKSLGVGRGDCVGLYAPMIPEMVAAFFAAMKIGARIVPVFCGFGETALAERLDASKSKVLFAVTSMTRRGKAVDVAKIARKACELAPSVSHIVWLDAAAAAESGAESRWTDFIAAQSADCETAVLPAEEPCLIIYTSGTTGKPKGTVHTHAGCLAQMGKELRYNFDVQPRDVFFWFTDIGWMMGPWELIGAMMYGASVVLLDGAPDYPDAGRLWRTLARHRVRTFGVSPTAIRLLMRAGDEWPVKSDLSALEILGSTGEPWDPTSYMWFFEKVGGSRCPVINISGGTEIVGCLLMPSPLIPLKPCTLGMPSLGMDVDVFDEDGKSIRGGIGHLVCKKPAPSMTKGFLHDDERYIETYFTRFGDSVWYHGDWAHVDDEGYWYLHGRSDDTIKVAGKRIGPAEVEAALISHPAVSEAATIGAPDELKGEVLVCFVLLRPGATATEDELKDHVCKHIGKPLRPKAVHAVAALPKTRSGKILRGTIKRAYLGQPLGDLSSVDNPGALEGVAGLAPAP